MPIVVSRALAALLAVLAGIGAGLLMAAPAEAARTLTISITADGPKPATLTASAGDTIVFKNDDATFVHQARSASPNWSFDTRPLAPGQSFTVGVLSKPGDYRYAGANLDDFTGRVVVPAPAESPPARPSSSPSGEPGESPPPPSAQASPSSSPTGGSGDAGAPSLGGFGGAGGPSDAPEASASALPPAVAAPLPGVSPSAAATEEPGVVTALGSLPSPATARRYGLPVALATVGVVGALSLIARVLLAQPTAARAAASPARQRRRTA